MAKHTEWPWKIQDDGYGMIGVLFSKGYGILIGRKDKESIANANLIAAAPDLFEALEELAAMVERQEDFNDDGDGLAIDRCHAAIAKAKGRK